MIKVLTSSQLWVEAEDLSQLHLGMPAAGAYRLVDTNSWTLRGTAVRARLESIRFLLGDTYQFWMSLG